MDNKNKHEKLRTSIPENTNTSSFNAAVCVLNFIVYHSDQASAWNATITVRAFIKEQQLHKSVYPTIFTYKLPEISTSIPAHKLTLGKRQLRIKNISLYTVNFFKQMSSKRQDLSTSNV